MDYGTRMGSEVQRAGSSAECRVLSAECGAGAGIVRRVVGAEAELART
jgi:hypothetical protein